MSTWTHSVKIVTSDRRLGRLGAVPVAGRRGEYSITFYGTQHGDVIRALGDIDTEPGQQLARKTGAGWQCTMKWIRDAACYVVPRPDPHPDELPRPPITRQYVRSGDHVYPVFAVGEHGEVEAWERLTEGQWPIATPTRGMPYRRVHPVEPRPPTKREKPHGVRVAAVRNLPSE